MSAFRHRPQSASPAAVACAALALLVTAPACKKKEEAPQPSGEQAQTVPAEGGPKNGGHIKLPSTEPTFLNPIIERRFERANMLIFEGLVGLDARLEPQGRLAEKWEVSQDSKMITFKLRKNAKWHDGEPFTSKDVLYTFNAIRNTRAQTVWRAYMSAVDKLDTPDDHTVVVHYKYPYGPALVTWTVGILPAHVFGDGDIVDSPANEEPVGTGPFKYARWERKSRLVLQANTDWWRSRPHLDSVELVFDLPDQDRVDKLRERDIDFARIESNTEWIDEAQLPEFREEFELSSEVEARFRAIAWNTQRAPFSDKRVRQALTFALNRSRVIDDVLLREAQPISAPLFVNMFGYNASVAPRPFDLTAAVKLLDEAGHPVKDGKRFPIDLLALESQGGPEANNTLAIFRNDLSGIGIELKVTYLPQDEYFKRIRERAFDAVYFGWVPDIADPDPYALLHSSQVDTGFNFAVFINPEVDRLLEEARGTTNRDERKTRYESLHRVLFEEVPYTPLYSPYGHYAWTRRLRGVSPKDVSPQPRFPGLAQWWVVPPGAAPAAN